MAPYSRNHELTAWGERRSVSAWAADDRCSVDYVTILQRVERGWSSEDAITAPIRTGRARHTWLTAFGETKAIADWAEDERCAVMLGTLRKRLREGWEAERAVTTPRKQGHMLTAFGETKTLADWVRDPRAVGGVKTLLWRLSQGWEAEDVVAGR